MTVLVDLLMATMDSISVWSSAAGDREVGLAWRDAVTARMIEAGAYVPYEQLVAEAGAELRLPPDAPTTLRAEWDGIRPWPDAVALQRLPAAFAFVTNCSAELAAAAVARSGLRPAFTLSAEEAGWYKPRPEIYRQACDRFAVDPRRTVFVAGAAYDARGAAAAGMHVFQVARRPPSMEDPVLPATVRVVASLADALPGP
ncbi:MAG TPA: HAD-IA family hydrolase [Candidatus Limnocylindria bacterium]|nr:HAD-IA family hydrolase [Candidatus Limnocylindria bacterium]